MIRRNNTPLWQHGANIRAASVTLNTIEEVRATYGFALLRASGNVLQDAAGNNPINRRG